MISQHKSYGSSRYTTGGPTSLSVAQSKPWVVHGHGMSWVPMWFASRSTVYPPLQFLWLLARLSVNQWTTLGWRGGAVWLCGFPPFCRCGFSLKLSTLQSRWPQPQMGIRWPSHEGLFDKGHNAQASFWWSISLQGNLMKIIVYQVECICIYIYCIYYIYIYIHIIW